jgi:hypothetical protein
MTNDALMMISISIASLLWQNSDYSPEPIANDISSGTPFGIQSAAKRNFGSLNRKLGVRPTCFRFPSESVLILAIIAARRVNETFI